jgi:hypothetical protein
MSKDDVVQMLRSQGEHDKAQQIDSALPKQIDTERDAGLLSSYDIHVRDLARVH